MKNKIILFLLLFAPISSINSSGLGIRYEVSYLSTNFIDHFSPIHLYLSLKTDVYSNTYIKLNGGISAYEELFVGLCYSIFIEKEFYKNYKLIGGVNVHKNGSTAHSTIEALDKTFLHYVIGTGVNISEDTSLDFLVYFPTRKKYSANYLHSPNILYRKVNYILKIGIEYYF